MREYIEKTWGWNEEFQRASFAEHLPWQRFQIITVGPIPVGGAFISDSPSSIDLEMIIIDPRFSGWESAPILSGTSCVAPVPNDDLCDCEC